MNARTASFTRPSGPQDKRGFLNIKLEAAKPWTRRWVVIEGNQLVFYQSATDRAAKGSLTLRNIVINRLNHSDKKWAFEVDSTSDRMAFAADSENDMKAWIAWLDSFCAADDEEEYEYEDEEEEDDGPVIPTTTTTTTTTNSSSSSSAAPPATSTSTEPATTTTTSEQPKAGSVAEKRDVFFPKTGSVRTVSFGSSSVVSTTTYSKPKTSARESPASSGPKNLMGGSFTPFVQDTSNAVYVFWRLQANTLEKVEIDQAKNVLQVTFVMNPPSRFEWEEMPFVDKCPFYQTNFNLIQSTFEVPLPAGALKVGPKFKTAAFEGVTLEKEE